MALRIVVTGASGNVGTALLRRLVDDPAVAEVVGLARRRPSLALPKVTWLAADVRTADLASIFRGADAVVHLAWLIQPSHDAEELESVNVVGTDRVADAVAAAGVRTLVHASSVGAYSPGPKDRAVDESWPTDGVASSFYSRHKAIAERRLDRLEADYPEVRVVRLRKGLIFKGDSASGIRRLFVGPAVPGPFLRPSHLPFVPDVARLRVQAVHADDVAEAYRLALHGGPDVRGAFNIAAAPVLDPSSLAAILGARKLRVPAPLLRAVVAATWKVGLQPTPPGWLDLALGVPLMATDRARDVLGWTPRVTAGDALRELLEGMADEDGTATPPLQPWRGAVDEAAAGVSS
jgi:nucleoside-diphosphate-sugar epimerase